MTAAGERLVTRPFVVLVAAGLAFFTAGGAVLPVASQFAQGPLDATTLGVGIAIGAFAIGSLVLRPVVGWGSDRFGRRPMLLLGTLLSIAGLALGLLVVGLLEYRDSSFRRGEEVLAALSLPVLASIPLMKSDRERQAAKRRYRMLDVGGTAVLLAAGVVLALWRP